MTSVVWDPVRAMFYAAVRSHGYYSSPNGVIWTRLTTQPGTNLTTANCPVGANGAGSANCPIYRGVLAVQPATGDLYALTVDANNLDQGLWQDLCSASSGSCAKPAPTFANRIDNGALEVGSGSTVIAQGSYNLALNAAPAASNTTNLYVGTIDLYACSMAAGSSACSLRNTTNALDGCNAPAQVAAAQHAITTVTQSSGVPILFLGNDSGLWRSLDGVAETGSVCSASDSTHFDNLNAAIGAGGSLSETIAFAQNPANTNILIAGLGAMDPRRTSTANCAQSLAAALRWRRRLSGYRRRHTFQLVRHHRRRREPRRLPAGQQLRGRELPPACDHRRNAGGRGASQMDTPILLDPALTTSLLIGTCRVWRGPASNGATWSNANALSPALGGTTIPAASIVR